MRVIYLDKSDQVKVLDPNTDVVLISVDDNDMNILETMKQNGAREYMLYPDNISDKDFEENYRDRLYEALRKLKA